MKKKFLLPFVLACMTLGACSQHFDVIDDGAEIENIGVTSVALSEKEVTLAISNSVTLEAFVEGTDTDVIWVCDNSNVIRLTKNGTTATCTALSTGQAYVTAIAGNKSASCRITVGSTSVVVTVNSIEIEPLKTLFAGENYTYIANVNSTGGTPILNWVSSNEAVATISKQSTNTALLTAKEAGETTITVVAGGKTATSKVTVEDAQSTLSVRLNTSSISLELGQTNQLTATIRGAESATWQSNNTSVAEVSDSGLVTAKGTGTAIITASITDGTDTKTAQCTVAISGNAEPGEYEQKIAAWSQPGHLYLHYLRKDSTSYGNWALWIWQNYPYDLGGTLWGANPAKDLNGINATTFNYMSKAECGESGVGDYIDEYGQIIDVDLTRSDIVDGKENTPAPLVGNPYDLAHVDEAWNDISKLALGFLIVDQDKMDGSDMWVSDGGAETYIKKIGRLMPKGKESYLHVYCVEGSVSEFKTSSGVQTVVNPTLDDTTGKYRSKNDITNLKYDAFTDGVATSTTFLQDKPGVGYQIFVPAFADSDGDGMGDLRGIIAKLPYLKSLGVEVLWLTPIQESNSYHGYDVTDYYKIDPRYGTMEDYQELLYKAHQSGMKVLMDMVINHTSKSNVLYKKSQKAVVETINGKEINYRDMYLWKYQGDQILEWDGVEGKYDYSQGKHATFIKKNVEDSDDWYRDGTSNYYYYGKFGSGMAELNYSAQATRDYMTEMCKYWLSFGLDGFRLDAIKHIYLLAELDTNYNYMNDYITYDVGHRTYYNTEMKKEVTVQNDYTYDRDLNVIFWKQFAGTIKSAYPNCFFVGENFDGWDARIAPFYEAIDSQFDFSTYYHLNERKPESIGSSVKHSLTGGEGDKGYYSYRTNAINGAYTSNHDIARLMNHAFVHNQSVEAKYGGGDAIHHGEIKSQTDYEHAINMAKYYAAVTILTPGVSWIYYGDEIGLTGNTTDGTDGVDDHGNNVDRWYRQPMKWGNTKGQDYVTNYMFGGIRIAWDNINQNYLQNVAVQEADENSLLSYFKLLTEIKNDDKYPTYGYVEANGSISGASTGCFMEIKDGVHTVRVRINNGDTDEYLQIPDGGTFMGGSKGATNQKIPAHGFHVILA